ncbi:hypothetical protein [Methylomicrobium agile]|uniref:hypothetical protein n=1 Tax=Methylomicrobium agile TaxID=39774 RepID=UPI0004DED1DB|nr:hypothetical protein [Methylomicrobium agile]
MNCRFELVDIRLVWDRIKADVDALKAEYNLDWRSEDVYAQCLMGRAFCYVCPDGFVIVKPQENPFTLAKELFVWICVGRGGDDLNEYYPDICAIAKDIYATAIIFESPRPGFRRLAERNHWPGMTAYRLPVV